MSFGFVGIVITITVIKHHIYILGRLGVLDGVCPEPSTRVTNARYAWDFAFDVTNPGLRVRFAASAEQLDRLFEETTH
ncbi:hypothetical protein C478_07382 [Natrinema thermotolerans DSM 11552]|nr:hypothetical protein C478_07382 [Natrinema thermotolerans DSM 11552]